MKNFENEYRSLVQDDMPDLWDRIEAGLVEKRVPQDMAVEQKEKTQQESIRQEVRLNEVNQLRVDLKENTTARNGKNNIYRFVKYAGVAVAACLLFVLVMPTAMGMLATGGSSESAKMAEDAAPAAMAEGAMESAKMEAAPEEPAMQVAPTEGAATTEEVTPMEGAAPMEDGVREETELAEGVAGVVINEEAKATTNTEAGTIAEKRQEYEVFQENSGITLTAENITPTGLTIKCTQSGGRPAGELLTGSWYVLQKWTQENGWEEMPYIIDGEIAWTSEAWTIPMDNTCEWEVDWEWLYGTVPNGKYRIGKAIMDFIPSRDYEREVCFIEFEITE